MVFLIVKYIHILAAITAFGLNLSYAVWISKARREPAHTAFALSGVKYLDDRIANLAYGVLLLTGLLMVLLAPYPIITFWIDASVALYAVVAVLAITRYTPTLQNQIKLAEAGDTSSLEFVRLAKRNQRVGQVLAVMVLVILAMMVFKPHL
jgi:uncharacterized membrane protein